MTETNDTPDPAAQLADAQAAAEAGLLEAHRARVSAETGIPEELLTGATTPEQIDEIAGAALGWQLEAAPPPPPPTGAVPAEWASGVGTIGKGHRPNPRYAGPLTREQVSRMSPQEILQAWKSGALNAIGVGAPQRNGRTTPMTRRP
jgi:hypothetical protein